MAGTIGTAELGLLFKAFGQFADSNSSAVAPTGESWNRLVQEILDFARLFEDYQVAEEGSKVAVRRISTE